jgi:hypothetical protein
MWKEGTVLWVPGVKNMKIPGNGAGMNTAIPRRGWANSIWVAIHVNWKEGSDEEATMWGRRYDGNSRHWGIEFGLGKTNMKKVFRIGSKSIVMLLARNWKFLSWVKVGITDGP